jgi:Mn-dependent DtxR family transcriptional regulator
MPNMTSTFNRPRRTTKKERVFRLALRKRGVAVKEIERELDVNPGAARALIADLRRDGTTLRRDDARRYHVSV